MPGETHNGMPCSEFEALLFDALDQKLTGSLLETFRAHARGCSNCGTMYAEIEAGQHWLKSLTEVEPPANLVNNILTATSGLASYRLQEPAAARYQPSLGERIREFMDSSFTPVWATVRQPRFAMSFGMAFFSLSVALSVFGVKPRDLKQVDLSRNGLSRTYYGTQARVVRYYENMRLVYEIESRVREFKKVTAPEPAEPEKDKEHKNNSSGAPEPRQDRNYASDEIQPVLASAPDAPPAVSVTTIRRFV
jgi:hypothetical protein